MKWFRIGICAALLGSVMAACTATERTEDRRPTPPDTSAFVGQWFQHAGVLNIGNTGDVDMTYQVGQPPSTSSFPELKLRLESVEGDTANAVVTSSNDAQIEVGSAFTFRRTDPGMVVTTPDGSTLIWCDVSNNDLGTCGA